MNKARRFVFLLLTVLAFLIFTGCQTTSLLLKEKYTDPLVLDETTLCPEHVIWSDIEVNGKADHSFQKTSFKITKEKIEWKCVKIDLDTPGLELTALPLADTKGSHFYLKDFSRKTGAIVAVNTVPFDMVLYLPVGIVKIAGQEICPANEAYAALTFTENPLRAKIINHQNEEELSQCSYAFGGFFTILEDGYIYGFEKYKRSRTAAGISDDGRFLYLFATRGIGSATGRNGLNFEECAIILRKLGCSDAMEFDGGHSSGLTVNGRNELKPIFQRKIPAAFGIKYN